MKKTSVIKNKVTGFLLYMKYEFKKARNSMFELFVKRKKKVVLFDTSISSNNKGDEIINYYCRKALASCFDPSTEYYSVPTHCLPSEKQLREIRHIKRRIVCGTNILSPNISEWSLWKTPSGLKGYHNIIPMGIGWGYYSQGFTRETSDFYHCIMNEKGYLSVRDSYTEKQMKSMGFKNVLNTGCPTLWELTPEFCKTIPKEKADFVITTITDYKQNIELDQLMLDILFQNYKKVFIWLQGSKDEMYLEKLNTYDRISVIDGGLDDYSHYLSTNRTDYVGTRLHAGIFAMNHGVRSIIIAVDNRATEMSKDFNLQTIERMEIATTLEKAINESRETILTLPWDNICKWKSQFSE